MGSATWGVRKTGWSNQVVISHSALALNSPSVYDLAGCGVQEVGN